MTLQQLLDQAMQHHQAGRLDPARALYHQILQTHPNQPDAMNLLGFIAHQMGNAGEAIDWTRKAIAAAPNDARYHFNLGETLRFAGQHEQAEQAYRAALRLDPKSAMAGHALGMALEKLGRDDEAMDAFGQAIAINPRLAPAYESLANTLFKLGRHADSADACRKGLAIDPNRAPLHAQLGAALADLRDFKGAMAENQRAATLWPKWSIPHVGMANVFQALGRWTEAEACARQAVALDPSFAPAANALALALDRQGRLADAREAYERSIALGPDDPRARANLAVLLLHQLDHDRSLKLLREAVALLPTYAATHGMLLSAMNYADGVPADQLAAEHRNWAAAHAAKFAPPALEFLPADPDPNQPLRVGYLSPDLIEHPVAHFLDPILTAHDRARFTPIIYSDTTRPDAMTQYLRRLISPANWHDVAALSDDALAQRIRDDRIDILVDLAGHTSGNRLLVFARKPAPVQVTYLGYPNTTGLPRSIVDYRLTDAHCDPTGSADEHHTERLLRLPRTFLCYSPSIDSPEPAPAPCAANGYVTFGSFNTAAKITRRMMEIWGQIIERVPGSRLLLKSKAMGDPGARDIFCRCGIDADRLILLSPEHSHLAHLDRYRQMDIALDTFPYHGTTTTCEAIWMGVPVITLAGEVHRARVGVSLLSNLGLERFVAQTPEQYIDIAANVASDAASLSRLRACLRQRMRNSPLMDSESFTRDLEAGYRSMWSAASKQSA